MSLLQKMVVGAGTRYVDQVFWSVKDLSCPTVNRDVNSVANMLA